MILIEQKLINNTSKNVSNGYINKDPFILLNKDWNKTSPLPLQTVHAISQSLSEIYKPPEVCYAKIRTINLTKSTNIFPFWMKVNTLLAVMSFLLVPQIHFRLCSQNCDSNILVLLLCFFSFCLIYISVALWKLNYQ